MKVDSLSSIAWARRALRTGVARSIREAAGVSGGEFAAGVGVTPSAVSRWERGKRTPRAAEAERVAHALRSLMEEA